MAAKKGSRCPVCGAPTDPAFKPFCSKRCKDVDLNRWLKGAYSIPVVEDDDLPAPDEGDDRA
ncbi:DNA gyrase inhibitor YacG [Pleomorphomonas carboxyditropha]|uniref:DNA gyrase inhibitor YacG n=2 Tax=Pleomorphomonas TaxID=261933 RepID=A0A2G9WQP0_9HYPH|nr:DNA gyrase inhibitor YacG [Pleomorphomonas carboxyditropha]PIO97016.1 DNA gyrase inhibitor YacG [Pleomorphomonas carboxyditropha]